MVDSPAIFHPNLRQYPIHRAFRKNSFAFNQKTVAFRIDKDAQIKNDSTNRELAEIDVNNFKTYLGAFYNMVVENLNRQSLTENDWERTVSISDAAIGPKLRKLSKTEVQELIANGRKRNALILTKQ
jgi:NTE family protein